MSSQLQEPNLSKCPRCKEQVLDNPMNCCQCMDCSQKIHNKCLILNSIDKVKPEDRIAKDDILICPVCNGDSIALCSDLSTNINEDIITALKKNPTRKGGKTRKTKKPRKTRKLKKTRKPKKYNK